MSHVFDTDELIGTQVGRYRIDARIARGGMGVLYRAEHTGLARTAALKVIAPELAATATTGCASSARRAARRRSSTPTWSRCGISPRTAACCTSPCATSTAPTSVSIDRSGAPAGATARGRARRASRVCARRGPRAWLVHRDVKPANMLIDGRGGGEHVWVTDFGLARASARSRTDLTRHGAILARWTSSRRSSSTTRRSTAAPTSTRSAACSSMRSAAACRSHAATTPSGCGHTPSSRHPHSRSPSCGRLTP